MSGDRDSHQQRAAVAAGAAFDAGVRAVLSVVYDNLSLGQAGIVATSIGDEAAERIRALRKRVHKKKAYPKGAAR